MTQIFLFLDVITFKCMTFDPYVTCNVCNGKGWYPKTERIGSQKIDTPHKCEYCDGKGRILRSKLRLRPLHDKYGRPIDEKGRVIKNPNRENWLRKKRRDQLLKEWYGD